MNASLQTKFNGLKEYLISLESVAVAFSNGVDSTFLLKVAHDTLGDKAVAVTAKSHSFPERELRESEAFCHKEHIAQIVCSSKEMEIPEFRHNPKNRCYLCKHELFSKILKIADELDLKNVCEGSNLDDNGDYRPGLQAIAELNIKSPLRHAGLSKQEIRELSKELGLPTWEKQSFACLASRFVYGEEISDRKLSMVDRAEELLSTLGFKQFRVRIHGDKSPLARIEVAPKDLPNVLAYREKIAAQFKSFGFAFVSLDLLGYKTGSMNVF